jgi:hypothetical protein
MLLIATNRLDHTADYLVIRMRERSLPVLRLNTEDLGTEFEVTLWVDSGGVRGEIHLRGGATVGVGEITGAYLRRPRTPPAVPGTEDDHRTFAEQELAETLRALWSLVPPQRWLNTPEALRASSVKVRQLALARECGLSIPPTCITSHRASMQAFSKSWPRPFITKAVRSGFIPIAGAYRLAATTRLPSAFPGDVSEYAPVPATYQPELAKACDVRVTVVDQHVFAAAISSQEHPGTETDWRLCGAQKVDLRHEPFALSPEVSDACRELTRRLGLRFSAIDLVEGTDGRLVFLEANPNGEWMWLERRCGFPLRDTIIDAMAGRE